MRTFGLAFVTVCGLAGWNATAQAQQPYFGSPYGRAYSHHPMAMPRAAYGAPYSAPYGAYGSPVTIQPYPVYGGAYGLNPGYGVGGGYSVNNYFPPPSYPAFPAAYPPSRQEHHHHHHHSDQHDNRQNSSWQSHPWHPGHYLFGI